MANMIFTSTFDAPTSVTGSHEHASFPASNVKLLRYPRRCWKAGGSYINGETVTYDFGTTTGFAACVLDDTNFTSVSFRAGSTSACSDYSSGAQTISQDGRDGRYKIFYATGAQTYRYVQLYVESMSVNDGTGNARVGSFAVLNTYTTAGGNFGYPLEWTPKKPVMSVGTSEPIALGGRYCEIVLNSASYPNSASMAATMNTLMGYGEDTLLCFYLNNSDTSEVYLCDRVGSTSISKTAPNTTKYSQIVLREVGELIGG